MFQLSEKELGGVLCFSLSRGVVMAIIKQWIHCSVVSFIVVQLVFGASMLQACPCGCGSSSPLVIIKTPPNTVDVQPSLAVVL